MEVGARLRAPRRVFYYGVYVFKFFHSFILQRTLFLHRSLFSTLDRSRGDPDDGEVAASRGIDDDVARGGAKFTLRLGERVDGAPSSAG